MTQTKPSSEQLRDVKLRLLRMHFEAGVGHIGGNLSAIDILMCLHHGILRAEDQFILSKGHAAGALYVTLWSLGLSRNSAAEAAPPDSSDVGCTLGVHQF